MATLIKTQNLRKRFGDKAAVDDHAAFTARPQYLRW